MKLKQGIFFSLFISLTFLVQAQEMDPMKALSLARIVIDGKINIIQVEKLNEQGILGVNLSESTNYFTDDIFDFIETIGYDSILVILSSLNETVHYNAIQILPPVDVIANTIAVANNYPEHKKETNTKIEPILFPKITDATSYVSNVTVDKDKELLDYEVELAVVYSKNTYHIKDLNNQFLGFITAIDYSDRARVLKAYDSDHPELAVGFTDSKSRKGYLPLGAIMVVPQDWRTYYKKLRIHLFHNSNIEQKDTVKNMYWDIQKITDEALKLGTKEQWTLNKNPVSLLSNEHIEKGTILLTGTPGGVIFRPPTKFFVIRKAVEYIILLKFFTWIPKDYVIDRYIQKLIRKKQFLKRGDSINAYIENLGYIYSNIK